MKITGINIVKRSCDYVKRYPSEARQANMMDIYEDPEARASYKSSAGAGPASRSAHFIEINTDEGVTGRYGVIESKAELYTIMDGLKDHLIGKNPLENRMLWDIMSRYDRHSRSGLMMMAISALDIALWDLKGKILGQPVYKILGGGRSKIRPYVSTLGLSPEPESARKRALEFMNKGVKAQKWFFRYGPRDGAEGIQKNLDMAFAVREAVGEHYELMFDCYMGWTVSYARRMFHELEKVHPVWVEEVLRAHMNDGFRQLRNATSIPLSAGEHLYTRMEVNTYLRDNVFAVMQSDPVWCGGITEALKIADLCEMYGVTFIPHGHSLMPAMQVIASMPADTCPYCELLVTAIDGKNAFFKPRDIDKDGFISMNDSPGLGDELDEARITSTEIIRSFEF